MKRNIFAISIVMLLIPMMMEAQALRGSYFLDNSVNRNKLNPALAPNVNYFQIPLVGNFGSGMVGNISPSTFLYPKNGELYTFLNKNVTVAEFESALARHPYVDAAVDFNLINFGWKKGKSYWTVDMGFKMDGGIDVPADLFLFMKKGSGTSSTFDIGNMKFNASLSAHAALGYSRDLSDLVPGLRVGAKARAILPLAYASIDFENTTLTTSPDRWTLSTKGNMHAVANEIQIVGPDGEISPELTGIPGPVGFGFSVDLGAEYRFEFDGFINGVQVSAAITDLGMMSYNEEYVQSFVSGGNMEWTGMEDGNLDGVMTDLENELGKLLEFEQVEGGTSLSRSTLPSFHLGAEMPFLNNSMSIGALYTLRKSFCYVRNELTLSYNLTPVKWFSLGLNYSFLNVTKSMGAVLELTPKGGPCISLGVDYFPMEWGIAPEGFEVPLIPMSSSVSARLGLAIALGRGK